MIRPSQSGIEEQRTSSNKLSEFPSTVVVHQLPPMNEGWRGDAHTKEAKGGGVRETAPMKGYVLPNQTNDRNWNCEKEESQEGEFNIFNAKDVNLRCSKEIIENTKKDLVKFLQDKLKEDESLFSAFIEPYLGWMLEQHKWVKIEGLSMENTMMSLERIYVTLRQLSSTTYERYHFSKLVDTELDLLLKEEGTGDGKSEFSPEKKRIMRWRLLAKILMPGKSYHRGRSGRKVNEDEITSQKLEKDSFSLGHAFRLWRWMVILGDPGSGKTNIVKWIAIKLASSLLEGKQNVVTEAYKTDVNVTSTLELLDLGPSRLPVLFRVSEFAQLYRDRNGKVSLIDYLGSHSWMGNKPQLSPEILNAIIKLYLLQGKAVILMDGLDEITSLDERSSVVDAIESFLEDWTFIPSNGGQSSVIYSRGSVQNLFKSNFLENDHPVFRGGNQVIITSRVVGYHAAPLTGNLTHLVIEPLKKEAILTFCDSWFSQIEKEPNSKSEKKLTIKNQLTKKSRRDLASNMLLLNILAVVHHNNEGSELPNTRVQLYQATLERMLKIWQRTIPTLTITQMVHILAPLAAHIHENYSTGLVEETELAEIVRYNIDSLGEQDKVPAINLKDLLNVIRNEVGILVARGEYLYGFIHLTFQEYLAGRYLVWNKEKATELVMSKLYDPRWTESIRMALAWVSWQWPQTDFEQFLLSILKSNDSLNGILPNAAIQITSSNSELVNHVTNPVLEGITKQFLNVISNAHLTTSQEILNEVKLGLSSIQSEVLVGILVKKLKKTKSPSMAMAIATVIKELNLFTPEIMKALLLLRVLKYDRKERDWPIDETLRMISLKKSMCLPKKIVHLRKLYSRCPSPIVQRLILALNGGVKMTEVHKPIATVYFHRYSKLIRILDNDLKSSPEEVRIKLWDIFLQSNVELASEALVGLIICGDKSIHSALKTPDTRTRSILDLALSHIHRILTRNVLSERHFQVFFSDIYNYGMKGSSLIPRADVAKIIELVVHVGINTIGKISIPQKCVTYWRYKEERLKIGPLMLLQLIPPISEDIDFEHELAVALDTKLGDFVDLWGVEDLATILAYTGRHEYNLPQWKSHYNLVPSLTPESNMLEEAIDVIGLIEPKADPLKLVLLEMLAPQIRENPDLLPESLIIASGMEWQNYREICVNLFEEQFSPPKDQLIDELLSRIVTVSNPYLQYRAYWRILQLISCTIAQFFSVLNLSLQAAKRVKDPVWKSYALWRLLPYLSPRENEILIDDSEYLTLEYVLQLAHEAAISISSHFEKAQALARLSPFFHIKEQSGILLASLESIKEESIGNKAKLLKSILPLLQSHSICMNIVDEIINEISETDPSAIDVIYDCRSSVLIEHQPKLHSLFWNGIIIQAIANDFIKRYSRNYVSNCWKDLCFPEYFDNSLKQLKALACKELIPLNLHTCQILDGLISNLNSKNKNQDTSKILDLLSIVAYPEPNTLPIIQRWCLNENQTIRAYAIVLLAEANQLSASNVDPLLCILSHNDDDRLRYRASATLAKSHKVSFIGRSIVEEIATGRLKYLYTSARASLACAWFFGFLVHDDADAISYWISVLESEDPSSKQFKVIQALFRCMSRIGDKAWDALIDGLKTSKCVTQKVLLSSIDRLIRKWNFSVSQYNVLRTVLLELLDTRQLSIKSQKLTLKILAWTKPVEDSVEVILQAITKVHADVITIALAALGDAGRVSKRQEVKGKVIKILLTYLENAEKSSDVNSASNQSIRVAAAEGLVRLNPDLAYITKQLKGDHDLIFQAIILAGDEPLYNSHFRSVIKSGGELISKNPALFQKAIKHLEEYLRKALLSIEAKTRHKLEIIPEVLAAAVPSMPEAFMNLADPRVFSELLSIGAQHLPSFPTRIACFELLSYLQVVPNDIFTTLRCALYDVGHVRLHTLNAITQFRTIPKELLPELLQGLYNKSTLLAYSFAQILGNIAQDSRTSTADSLYIISSLSKAVQDPALNRGVYILQDECNAKIQYIGQLNQLIYDIILRIVGTSKTKVIKENTTLIKQRIEVKPELENIKKCKIPCRFGDSHAPFFLYLGNPHPHANPVFHQKTYLSNERDAYVPEEVLETLERLLTLSSQHNINFAQLCEYALDPRNQHIEGEGQPVRNNREPEETNDILTWPTVQDPDQDEDPITKEEDETALIPDKATVKPLLQLCIAFIKANQSTYNYQFSGLPQQLRELVEDIGPNKLTLLVKYIPFLNHERFSSLLAMLKDWIRVIPQPYNAISYDISVSINLECITIYVTASKGIFIMETFEKLYALWERVGGNVNDLQKLQEIIQQDMIAESSVGFWIYLTSRSETGDVDFGWHIVSKNQMSIMSLLFSEPTETTQKIIEICCDRWLTEKCNFFGRNVGLSPRQNQIKFAPSVESTDDQCRLFDTLTRTFDFHRLPEKVADTITLITESRALTTEADDPLEISLTLTSEDCVKCALTVPFPPKDRTNQLFRLYGRAKLLSALEEGLGISGPNSIEFQYIKNGFKGLNKTFDILLHYKI